MAESEVKIRVTADTNTLKGVREELKRILDLKGKAQLGSKEFDDLTKSELALRKVIKENGANYESYIGHVKRARAEKRALNFAIIELMHGFEGLAVLMGGNVENNKKMIQGLQGAISAGAGLKFQLDLVGGALGRMAGPAGIVIGLLVAFAQYKELQKQRQAELDKEFDKELEILKMKRDLGLVPSKEIEASVVRQITAKEEQKAALLRVYGVLSPKALADSSKLMAFDFNARKAAIQGSGEKEYNAMFPAKKEAEHLREVKEIDAAILKLELELKKIRDHEIDNLEKAAEYRDAFSKKLAGKLAYAEGKRRRAGARREDSSDFVDVGGITKEMTDSYDDFKTYIENPVLDGISNISMAWESQFHQNLLATFNDGKTVADQFFIGIAEGFNRILTDLATKGIMSLILSLLPGFNLASAWSFVGGKAGGGWVKPGQYAMVGENGPEMAYATAGGTYVYNNQKTIKQFEGTGGGVQVIPIIRADELSVMVKYGSQMRSGRRF